MVRLFGVWILQKWAQIEKRFVGNGLDRSGCSPYFGFWVHCLWAFGKVRTIPYGVFYCGQPTIKEVVGGCPHPVAEKRKYLPQTVKLFVGDDACIVPHDGQRKYIDRKSVGRERV